LVAVAVVAVAVAHNAAAAERGRVAELQDLLQAPAGEVAVPFPGYASLPEATRPTVPHGHLTPSDLTRARVPNGLPGKHALQVFALPDVLEQLVLGAVSWQLPCMGGAHFGTAAPVLVLGVSPAGLAAPGVLHSLWDAPPVQCLTPDCATFVFKAMTAVRHRGIMMSAQLAADAAAGPLFLALANPVCVPVGPTLDRTTELMPSCPRAAPTDPFVVVSHLRSTVAVCSGTLLQPQGSGMPALFGPTTAQIRLADAASVCVLNYADLAALRPDLCTNTTTTTTTTAATPPTPGL
jgi:hypothetical protein